MMKKFRTRFRLKETVVEILADSSDYFEVAKESIRKHREELERFIMKDPFFLTTFEPYDCPRNVPEIVGRMCSSAEKVNVGPMASVAGTIADLAVEAMVKAGTKCAVVENGGDISLFIDEPALVGIYAGQSRIRDIAFRVEPSGSILGICTSSGTVGPSISLGNADAATVVAENASLADACATALGNSVKEESDDCVRKSFDSIKNIQGAIGALVIIGSLMATWGKLPEVVKACVKVDF